MCIRQPSSRLFIGQNEASELFFLFHFLLFASSSSPPSIFASISMPLSLSLSLRHGPFFLCGFLERFFLRFLTLTRSNRQQTLLLGFLSNNFFFFFNFIIIVACFYFLLLCWIFEPSCHPVQSGPKF